MRKWTLWDKALAITGIVAFIVWMLMSTVGWWMIAREIGIECPAGIC